MRRTWGSVAVAAVLVSACSSGVTGSPSAEPTTTVATPAPAIEQTPAPPVTSTSASTPAPALPACVSGRLDQLSPQQRAAQLIMVGVPAANPASAASRLGDVGGVFLQGRSSAALATVKEGVDTVRAAAGAAGLLVSADQEGGQVQTLSGPGMPQMRSALEQGGQEPGALAAATRAWASATREAGIDLDLAPVADVVPAGTEDANPPIGAFQREYGSTPDTVSAAVGTVVRAAAQADLGTTAKHFPGLGRVTVNTDTAAGATDSTTTTDDASLAPFRAAIEARVAAVMVSSAKYPKLDAQDLAVFSRPIITDLLRTKLGFTGLVITDDVGAAVAVADVAPGERAVRFVAAGGDMVLTVEPTDVPAMTQALAARAARDPGFATQLDTAAGRVLQTKIDRHVLTC